MESVKCPTCGSNRFKKNGTDLQCVYCKTIIKEGKTTSKNESNDSGKLQNTNNIQQKVSVNVNTRSSASDSLVSGAAAGAGMAAGGCLTSAIMAVVGPIIGIIVFFVFLAEAMKACAGAAAY